MAAGDRQLTYRHGVAILQSIAFLAFLVVAGLIACSRRTGWFPLVLFSLVRLVGAACQLATAERDAADIWAGVMICESICIAFLTTLFKSLLARANRSALAIGAWGFLGPEIASLAGIGIVAAGFVYAGEGDGDPLAPNPITQSAVALFSAMYLYAVGLFVRLWLARDRIPPAERKTLVCFAACAPFVTARIVYSFIFIVTGDDRFNAVRGNPTIYLVMVALNEIGVVAAWASTVLRLGGRIPSPGGGVEVMRRRSSSPPKEPLTLTRSQAEVELRNQANS